MASAAVHDDLRVYLQQIARVPLLTQREERELGWRIINDDDCGAKNLLIVSNLRLVVSIAVESAGRRVALLDLIEEGNLGLIRAAEKFDPARGTRFSTYAACWIRRMVQREVARAVPIIHLPARLVELIDEIDAATRRHLAEHGRRPTAEELAEDMDISVRRIRDGWRALAASRVRPHGPHHADGFDAGERLSDDAVVGPDEVASMRDACRTVIEYIDGRAPREARVLRLRLGLEGRPPLSFRRIGKEIGLTGERARQLGVSGLCRLRDLFEAGQVQV